MERRWTFLLLLSFFVPVVSCEDIITGNVSESREDHSSSQSMPENIAVNVTITGQDVRLDLTLDLSASTDIPVYVFSRNKDGQLDTERVNRKINKHFAVYRDVTQGAVFSVRRDVDTGHGQLTLEGVVHVKGKVYDIKSSKRRHRNSTNQTTDGKTGSVGHDVQRRDVNDDEEVESNQTEAADNHEFIVRPLDHLPPRSLRGDAILPPITEEEEKRRKKKKIHYKNSESHESPETVHLAAAPPSASEQQSDLYIDVAAVVDYAVFSNWYANSSGITEAEKTQDVLDKLPEYYAFMFSGVNMLYEDINSSLLSYTLHVKLSAITIATHRTNSPWTETWRVRASPRDKVDCDKALDSFFKWAATSDLLPTYDHLTLFSGYDLFRNEQNSVINRDIWGIAYTGTMCRTDGFSSSLIEDLWSFESIFVVAHEMGHSLSAQHDGDTNFCSANGNNIMAAGFDLNGGSDLWRFSSCSINYFQNYISSTTATVRGHQCLYYSVGSNANIPDVSGQQPGQVYDYDAQCRQVYGPQSRLCRGAEFITSPSDICMNMNCDGLDDKCYKYIAARGTSCGNKKWCVRGDCVHDSQAPAMDENCPFGDLPGRIWFTNYTCAELIASDPSLCYNTITFGRCCASCAQYYRPVQNCEYGDRTSSCLKSQCLSANRSYLYSCCETCTYGTPITTDSTTTTMKYVCEDTSEKVRGRTCPALVAAQPATCDLSDVNTSCCASCLAQRTGIHGLCVDTSDRVRGQTCADLVATSPDSCYDSHVLRSCCASCNAHNTGVKGCEFGDRDPAQCRILIPRKVTCDEGRWEEECCHTCAYNLDRMSAAVHSPKLATSVLAGWMWTIISLLKI